MASKKYLVENVIKEFEDAKTKVAEWQNKFPETAFNQKPGENKWCAAECLEHLNTTNKGYIDNAKKKLTEIEKSEVENKNYKPRFLMGLFINMMKPDSKMKFKAPSKLQQSYEGNPSKTIETFTQIQNEYMDLANKSLRYDLKKTKIVSPVSSLLKFELGEMFLAMVEHQKRHLAQAERALNSAV